MFWVKATSLQAGVLAMLVGEDTDKRLMCLLAALKPLVPCCAIAHWVLKT
jgi:hypothetical protein